MHTYKVNTGREAALQNQVGELKSQCAVLEERIDEMKDRAFGDSNTINHLKEKYEEAKTNMALMTDESVELKERNDELKIQLVEWRDRSMGYTKEIEELKSELEELSKSYNDEHHETQVYKKAWREQRELVALRDDQIAMLERKLTKREENKI